MKPYSR